MPLIIRNYSAECFLSELGFVGLKDFRIICFISRRDDRSVEKRSPPSFFAFRRNATTRDNEVAFLRNALLFLPRILPSVTSLRDAIKLSYGMQNSLEKFR